jgi:hypothetical protein
MNELIKQLEEDGPDKCQTNLSSEVKAAFKESGKGNKEEAIRKRVHGDDDLTARYLGKMNSMVSVKITVTVTVTESCFVCPLVDCCSFATAATADHAVCMALHSKACMYLNPSLLISLINRKE